MSKILGLDLAKQITGLQYAELLKINGLKIEGKKTRLNYANILSEYFLKLNNSAEDIKQFWNYKDLKELSNEIKEIKETKYQNKIIEINNENKPGELFKSNEYKNKFRENIKLLNLQDELNKKAIENEKLEKQLEIKRQEFENLKNEYRQELNEVAKVEEVKQNEYKKQLDDKSKFNQKTQILQEKLNKTNLDAVLLQKDSKLKIEEEEFKKRVKKGTFYQNDPSNENKDNGYFENIIQLFEASDNDAFAEVIPIVKGEENKKKNLSDDVTTYYYNTFKHDFKLVKQDIKKFLTETLKKRGVFKCGFSLGIIIEEFHKDGDNEFYTYEHIQANPERSEKNIPKYIKDMDDIYDFIELFELTLHDKNNKINLNTKRRIIAITQYILSTYHINLLRGISIKNFPKELLTVYKYDIIPYPYENNFCFWAALYYCFNDVNENGSDRDASKIKKLLFNFYNPDEIYNPDSRKVREFIKNYPGFNMTELNKVCERFNLNFTFYRYEPNSQEQKFKYIEHYRYSKKATTVHMLLYTLNDHKTHIMKIKDYQKLTGYKFCDKCGNFMCKSYDKNRHAARQFNDHYDKCDGSFKSPLKLEKLQKPYTPFLDKQPILSALVSRGLTNIYGIGDKVKFNASTGFITFDFETFEETLNQKFGENSEIISILKPISIAMTVVTDKLETFYYDIRTNNFIFEFLKKLFEKAEEVKLFNINCHAAELDALSIDLNQKYPSYDIKSKIVEKFYNVNCYGYNSAKFDTPFLISYLNNDDYGFKCIKLIGAAASYKSIVATYKMANVKISFLDAMGLVSACPLSQFAKDFGNSDLGNKGAFPYDLLNKNTYKEFLNSSDIIPKESFYNTLKKCDISDEAYKCYVDDMQKNNWNHWDYLQYYNEQDTKIMVPAIKFLINDNIKFGIDLQNFLSLSSYASAIKYIMCYDSFDINGNYITPYVNGNGYKLIKEAWKNKVENYKQQDKKANRDIKNNVKASDYEYFKNMADNGKCYMCGTYFDFKNHRFTLDRIDNQKGHSIDNVKPCCEYCNKVKANRDEHTSKLYIQLKNYANLNNLPFTLSTKNYKAYEIIRNGITGGLSNVWHRVNEYGKTKINRLTYDPITKTINDYDTPNVITHVFGLDFNSLYPSAFSSAQHKFNPYTGGKMYMPGKIVEEYDFSAMTEENKNKMYHKCLNIINQKANLFIASIKCHIPEENLSKCIHLAPIFRNLEITTDENTLGPYMYNYLKEHDLTRDKKEVKLTTLFSSHGKFMAFSSYYLWFLIDNFGLIIDDMNYFITFDKHDKFSNFVTSFMNDRIQKGIKEKNNGIGMMRKIALNGSYGYDIMNEENFTNIQLKNAQETLTAHLSPLFKSERKISDNLYQINSNKKNFNCNTPIQEGFFTLDNAKFWYLNFLYNFIFKCMDMDKFHLIEGDTDSVYFALSGDIKQGPKQGFNEIIKDKDFYNANYKYFLPDLDNPNIEDEKKILGCTVEKYGYSMYALAPKCYTIISDIDQINGKCKIKGVSLGQNKHITHKDYKNILENGEIKNGQNTLLTIKGNEMSKITMNKTALSATMTKMRVMENGACYPFLFK